MFKKGPVPAFVHGVIEYLAGALLIAAPFVFGFDDDGSAAAFFIVLGVAHLLLTIATRFIKAPKAGSPGRAESGSPGPQPS